MHPKHEKVEKVRKSRKSAKSAKNALSEGAPIDHFLRENGGKCPQKVWGPRNRLFKKGLSFGFREKPTFSHFFGFFALFRVFRVFRCFMRFCH